MRGHLVLALLIAQLVLVLARTEAASIAGLKPDLAAKEGAAVDRSSLTFEEIDTQLQVSQKFLKPDSMTFRFYQRPDILQKCSIVRELGARKLVHATAAAENSPPSHFIASALAVLFPSSSPAVNALLATAYISGPPNLLLALCPPDVDPATLSTMVAFAVGGLLGDTLFHLVPEIFVGEDDVDEAKVRFVMVEPKRNLVLGAAMLVGLVTFVAMDKGLRIATGGGGHSHGREGQQSSRDETVVEGKSSALCEDEGLRRRKKTDGSQPIQTLIEPHEHNPSIKLGGYLNLM